MYFFILNIPLIKVQNRHLFDTVRPFKEVPMWSTGREVTQDSGSAWVRTEGMRRITEEENGVGRLQGQAESNWFTLPVTAFILVTFLIAATKYRTRSNLKKEGFVLVYRASQLDPQAGRKGWPGRKTSRSRAASHFLKQGSTSKTFPSFLK